MFTKCVSAFKLLLVVFTLVVCSSFIFIPPSFAGQSHSSSTGSGSSTSSDNSVRSECPANSPVQNGTCRP